MPINLATCIVLAMVPGYKEEFSSALTTVAKLTSYIHHAPASKEGGCEGWGSQELSPGLAFPCQRGQQWSRQGFRLRNMRNNLKTE